MTGYLVRKSKTKFSAYTVSEFLGEDTVCMQSNSFIKDNFHYRYKKRNTQMTTK